MYLDNRLCPARLPRARAIFATAAVAPTPLTTVGTSFARKLPKNSCGLAQAAAMTSAPQRRNFSLSVCAQGIAGACVQCAGEKR